MNRNTRRAMYSLCDSLESIQDQLLKKFLAENKDLNQDDLEELTYSLSSSISVSTSHVKEVDREING